MLVVIQEDQAGELGLQQLQTIYTIERALKHLLNPECYVTANVLPDLGQIADQASCTSR